MTVTSRRILAGLAAIAVAAPAGAALAQTAATGSGTASIVVGNALTVTRNADLNFGHIALNDPAAPATVAVGTSNSVTSLTNAKEVTGGSISSGGFDVAGSSGSTYAVTFPQASINLGAGAHPPTVDTFFTSLPSSVGQLSTDSSGIGTQSFSVGATLHIPANTAAGTYSGQFPVSVSYN